MRTEDRQKLEAEWVWGWDDTPGIVSVWAEHSGRVLVWRRVEPDAPPQVEAGWFRSWALLPALDDLAHLGESLQPEHEQPDASFIYRCLAGIGSLRYFVSASDGRKLEAAIRRGVSQRLGREIRRLGEIDADELLWLPADEQYLVTSGRTMFRGLAFDDLVRLQFDLETTGLDPTRDRLFLVAVSTNRGLAEVLDCGAATLDDMAEANLIRRLVALIRKVDPDCIENHNLLGFDLPFLAERANRLHVPLSLGRAGAPGIVRRGAMRGNAGWRDHQSDTEDNEQPAAERLMIPGRELIDTLHSVRRYDFVARELPSHGLKAAARHFGLAPETREYLEGAAVWSTWQQDPERVRRYALDDVAEARGLSRLLGGAAFALAQMAPRRYERLADAGPATGILDPMLVRAYLHAGESLPGYATGDGTQHTGAGLHLFATGVAQHVFKADVSSLYPSLMRQYRIGPGGDTLQALLALVDRLVEQRLAAKARARSAPAGSPERHTDEALSSAFKILVNAAYGYCGAVGLTRFADVHAANEITRRGRELLDQLCRELVTRGAVLLEADTDGVFAAAPAHWTEDDERRVVAEVGALLPPLVRLDYEGRYAAMLSHEPKNYALLSYDGTLLLRGVAFRSSRFEPFGDAFLRRAIRALLVGDSAGVRAAFVDTAVAIERRTLPTAEMTMRVRLKKSPASYLATRGSRREAPYEAMLESGQERWSRGATIRIYRVRGGRFRVHDGVSDLRDYDTGHYLRLLRETYAERLTCAYTAEDCATLFALPGQMTLFAPPLESITPHLTTLHSAQCMMNIKLWYYFF